MKERTLHEEIELPDKTQATVSGRKVTVKGPKGEVSREFKILGVKLAQEGNKITLTTEHAKQAEKKKFYTVKSHIKNMVEGATNGFTYKLKICSGHFPMTLTISGNQAILKNFLGEKIPRTMKIKDGATVKVEGVEVTVQGCDLEIVGQVAADIELLPRITNRDIRIFQDGIYITKKPE